MLKNDQPKTSDRADVANWLRHRSFIAADWPLDRVLASKEDTTISVVLPALNEEQTVGDIVSCIVEDLVDRAPLVDDVVVMDSGSTDRTGAVAQAAGARVVHQADVLPQIPTVTGKGDVLWRSLAATRSDIIVFVDADLKNFRSTFVTGLLGPLLADPTVQLVKAVYDRAIDYGPVVSLADGGRVTELMARPLLNLHWPQLAGFVQPLAGEFAARRDLLDQLPFPCGYGIELAMLVDTLRMAGLDAMAQVDLGERRHRNRDTASLGRMASEILHTAWLRIGPSEPGPQWSPFTLTQFERVGATYCEQVHDVLVQERPPMRTVARLAPGAAR
jgi:glucosyl-3-phosphoglycerate synthase